MRRLQVAFGSNCVVSVGEDATCCCWSAETGKLLRKYAGHLGRSGACAVGSTVSYWGGARAVLE